MVHDFVPIVVEMHVAVAEMHVVVAKMQCCVQLCWLVILHGIAQSLIL